MCQSMPCLFQRHYSGILTINRVQSSRISAFIWASVHILWHSQLDLKKVLLLKELENVFVALFPILSKLAVCAVIQRMK